VKYSGATIAEEGGLETGRLEAKIELRLLGSDLPQALSPQLRAKAALLKLAAVTRNRRKKSYILLSH
jgi:hypothetical protein